MINALPPRPPVHPANDRLMAVGDEYHGMTGVVALTDTPSRYRWLPAVGVVENDRITAHSISPNPTLLELGAAMQLAEHEASRVGKLVDSWVRK